MNTKFSSSSTERKKKYELIFTKTKFLFDSLSLNLYEKIIIVENTIVEEDSFLLIGRLFRRRRKGYKQTRDTLYRINTDEPSDWTEPYRHSTYYIPTVKILSGRHGGYLLAFRIKQKTSYADLGRERYDPLNMSHGLYEYYDIPS